MTMESLSPITPINFFQLSVPCYYLESQGKLSRIDGKHLLPDTSALCHEEHFANVALGWNEEGIELLCQVEKKFEEVRYPDVVQGDSVEVFIDTRDVKTSGHNTRFCHHFFFLPEAVEGQQAGEITHFRTEDTHTLCDPNDLWTETTMQPGEYVLHCFIPKGCLYGYDPSQFDRMGFSYRINRPRWESQHFSVVTDDYQLEQQPSLWSRMRLVR